MRLAIIVSLLAASVLAGPPKPTQKTLKPNRGRKPLSDGMIAHMPSRKATYDHWGNGWIPKECKNQASYHKLSPWDFAVFNVHYGDCGDAWIMCRHKDAEWSESKMVDLFGKLPVLMRQYVRHLVALPSAAVEGAVGLTYDNVIAVMGDSPPMETLVHEVGHVLDRHAYDPSFGIPFSSSDIWVKNQQMDTGVPEDYARASQIECLAVNTAVALYDKVVPGGIGNLYPDNTNGWGAIFHQYATIQGYLGDTMQEGGSCYTRPANSEVVAMGNSRRGILTSKPDVSFKSNITVIPDLPDAGELTATRPAE